MVVVDVRVVLREADLFAKGWRRARGSGLCVRCSTPFLVGVMVWCDRTAGLIGPCCAGSAA